MTLLETEKSFSSPSKSIRKNVVMVTASWTNSHRLSLPTLFKSYAMESLNSPHHPYHYVLSVGIYAPVATKQFQKFHFRRVAIFEHFKFTPTQRYTTLVFQTFIHAVQIDVISNLSMLLHSNHHNLDVESATSPVFSNLEHTNYAMQRVTIPPISYLTHHEPILRLFGIG